MLNCFQRFVKVFLYAGCLWLLLANSYAQFPDYLTIGKMGAAVELSQGGTAFTIGRVLPNGPAAMAGLTEGTLINRINYQAFSFTNKEDLVKELSGPIGSVIVLENGSESFVLTREALNVPESMGGPCFSGNCQNGEAVMHFPTPFDSYATYQGTVAHGLPNGKGSLTLQNPDNEVLLYEGYFNNGLYHGQGSGLFQLPYETYGAPLATFIGNWVHGKPEGRGVLTYEDGSTLEGIFLPEFVLDATLTLASGQKFEHGRVYDYREILCYSQSSKALVWYDLPAHAEGVAATCLSGNCYNGNGKSKTHDGQLYEGSFQFGFPHGKGTLSTTDGNTYTGDFYLDFKHGKGIINYHEGSTYSGGWMYGERSGEGKLTIFNGYVYEGMFKDNMPNGNGIITYKDGAVYKGYFLNGQPHGQGTFTHPDGMVSSGEFVNGKMHGKIVRQTPGGSTQIFEYQNGSVIRLVDLIWSQEDWQRNQQQIEIERKMLEEREVVNIEAANAPKAFSKAEAIAAINYLTMYYTNATIDVLGCMDEVGWDKISIANNVVWTIEELDDAAWYIKKGEECMYMLYGYYYHMNCMHSANYFHSMQKEVAKAAVLAEEVYQNYRACANNFFSSANQNADLQSALTDFRDVTAVISQKMKGMEAAANRCQ